VRAITLEELADEAEASPELIRRFVELGEIRPLPDGRFDARDAAILTTVRSLLGAGIELDDLAWAISTGRFGLGVVGRLFTDPAPRGETYAELVASLGPSSARLAAVYAALELPEPGSADRLREDEAAIIREFVTTWASVDPAGGADARVARLAGEGVRRFAEGWLDLWDLHARPSPASQGAPTGPSGLPEGPPAEPDANPTVRASAHAREFFAWLLSRHVERTLQDRIINAIESVLVAADRMPPMQERPQAIALVDLAGYTSMTEARGDEAAAESAARLQELAEAAVRRRGGRVVKLLGDGVLLRFDAAETAIPATTSLVAGIEAAGLPPARGGIAAGRIVVRDGDVFGRTVNLASRIAGQAGPGQVLVEEGVVVALPRGTAAFEPIGRVELKGIADPVALWRVKGER
jgi:class 3 adenylate cyclase